MPKPTLIIVTGEPGSGKSTLGRAIAAALHVPYLSRDDVRWALRATAGLWNSALVEDVGREDAVETFLQLVERATELGVSAVLEYMVFTSNPETLGRLRATANCVVLLTTARDAADRADRRDGEDPLLGRDGVLTALGHASVRDYLADPGRDLARTSMIREFDLPTLEICTDEGYEPPIPAIVDWIVSQTARQ